MATTWEGVTTPLKGFRFLTSQRCLWKFAIPPAIFNLVMNAVVVAILLASVWFWWRNVFPWFVEGQRGTAVWIWTAVAVAVGLFMLLAAFLTAIVVWRLASAIICSSLYARLAEQTERLLGIADDEIHSISFRQETADSLRDLAVWIGHQTLSFAVAFVPLVGPPIAICFSAHSTCFQLGLDYLQYPLTLRGRRREQRLIFAKEHRTTTLGFGSSLFIIEWMPIVSSVLLPSAVVGSVLLHRELTGETATPTEQYRA
jgi:uncharacterized protein involved in cysteine biosynthesis